MLYDITNKVFTTVNVDFVSNRTVNDDSFFHHFIKFIVLGLNKKNLRNRNISSSKFSNEKLSIISTNAALQEKVHLALFQSVKPLL